MRLNQQRGVAVLCGARREAKVEKSQYNKHQQSSSRMVYIKSITYTSITALRQRRRR